MGHAKRRRRQAKMGYTHIARLGRPIYRARAETSVQEAIAREQAFARRQAAMKANKK